MNRDEFMRELEYLLSDIPEEDKADAIDYYRDYFDEAGPENEGRAILEFGSPERIAAIIRSDISGNLEEGGEFTEHGYEDERFKDPNFQMTKRYDLPEKSQYQKENAQKEEREEKRPGGNRTVRIILWLVLFIVASPLLIGIGSGIFGLLAGLLSCLAALVIALGAVTGALLVSGIVCLLAGIITLVIHPMSGILVIGIGILLGGFGIMGVAVCITFYGRQLPSLFRRLTDALSRLVHRRRRRS